MLDATEVSPVCMRYVKIETKHELAWVRSEALGLPPPVSNGGSSPDDGF